MLQEIAELKVKSSYDYEGELVKAIEDAGFVIIKQFDTIGEIYYTVAKDTKE